MPVPRHYPIATSLIAISEASASERVPIAHIRPGVVENHTSHATLAPEALEAWGASGMLVEHEGHTWFDIDIPDLAMSHVRCRIGIHDGGVHAVFEVNDKNAHRLLDSSAGKLRNMLEARGLRVRSIKIVASGE